MSSVEKKKLEKTSWWSKRKKPQIRALKEELNRKLNPTNPDPLIALMMRSSTEKPRPFGESVDMMNRIRQRKKPVIPSPTKKARRQPPISPISVTPLITPESEKERERQLLSISNPTPVRIIDPKVAEARRKANEKAAALWEPL